MKKWIILFLSLQSLLLFGQHKQDYNWIIGGVRQTAIDSRDGVWVNFNNNPVTFEYYEKDMDIDRTTNTLSTPDGDLLMYTNGCYIEDSEGNIVENSTFINGPSIIHTDFCLSDDGWPMGQTSLLLPMPNNENNYMLIHKMVNNDLIYNTLRYTMIEYDSLDTQLVVIDKNIQIVEDSVSFSNLTAVKHANNTDWWILSQTHRENLYLKFLLDEDGIAMVDSQSIGFPDCNWCGGAQSIFSPDGEKMIVSMMDSLIHVYDFDRSTGELSNFQYSYMDDTIVVSGTGATFSPNSRFLYMSTGYKLFQYDMEAPDLEASKTLIDVYDGYTYLNFIPATFGSMVLGPDCRIYMGATAGVDVLHVINEPNEPGLACDFRQHAIQLPSTNGRGMPNFPHFRLGTDQPICDSTINLVLTANAYVLPILETVEVYPNPTSDFLFIRYLTKTDDAQVNFFDLTGKLVKSQVLTRLDPAHTIEMHDLPTGMYVFNIIEEGQLVSSGKVIVE